MTSHVVGSAERADEQAFQSASAEFLERLLAIRGLETRKAALRPGDPDRPTLARQVESLTTALLALSRYQTRLADAQAARAPAPRAPAVVLAEWRAAVRRVEEASVTTREHADEAARLQDEYRRGIEERMG